nr:MAG TPA: hypothetical protein [Caudoviricetes sp.]
MVNLYFLPKWIISLVSPFNLEKDFPIKVYFPNQNLKKIPLLVLVDLSLCDF